MIAPPSASLVSPFLQFFFAEHLIVHRRVSPETVGSYRDTFRLLLKFLQSSVGLEPSRLTLSDMQAPVILRFLDNIEQNRGNCARTRNARLAAIRSFFRLVALRDPASVDVATRVLAIPVKRWDHRLVGYLTRPEIDAILATPDTKTWTGRRDHALLLTLYNTGARVSEMVSVQRDQLLRRYFSAPLDWKRAQGTKCALMAKNRADSVRLARRYRRGPAPTVHQC
jgi:integrase/recombinase XerD